MQWPIRNQILLPFAVLLLLAVAATSLTSALLAARRSEQEAVEQLSRVMQTVGDSRFPLSGNVLSMMRGLSGAEFAVLDEQGRIRATTILGAARSHERASDVEAEDMRDTAFLAERLVAELRTLEAAVPGRPPVIADSAMDFRDARYRTAVLHRSDRRGRRITLVALYPEQSLARQRWQVATGPLVVGGVALLVAVLLSFRVASRMGSRIRTVQEQVAEIAGGRFTVLPEGLRRDEIDDLSRDVNRMSRQLQQMQSTIARTERSRLLWQMAGGLAHQLRNSVTGARLSIQLHRRRCSLEEDESLSVALRQLDLTETQLRGLLAVGRGERLAPVVGGLAELVAEVVALVQPACSHTGVELVVDTRVPRGARIGDVDGLRGALVNLLLNAAEAAGPEGRIALETRADGGQCLFHVIDSGPGPPEELEGALFELFTTGKLEGTGVGLALVAKVARENGGEVDWSRENAQTCFRLQVPLLAPVDGPVGQGAIDSPTAPTGSSVADPAAESPAPSANSSSQPTGK